MVTVTFIFHSCFLVDTPQCQIIFDFWKEPLGIIPDIFENDPDKPLYVLVSHFHKDHYNPEIFSWAKLRKNIHFILSRDTSKRAKHFFSPSSTHNGPHLDRSLLTVMQEGDTYTDEYVTIHAFGSTDEGNSYLVDTAGRRLFHAGDLNAWVWIDESTQKEVDDAINLFLRKLQPIKRLLSEKGEPAIDVAMFPVDSRLGTSFWLGAKLFLKELPVGLFLPMHFDLGDEEEQAYRAMDAVDFKLYANPDYPTLLVGPLHHFGNVMIPPGALAREKTIGPHHDISSEEI